MLVVGCTTLRESPPGGISYRSREPVPELEQAPLDPAAVHLSAEPVTVEDAFLLDLYTWLKGDDYSTYRVDYEGADGEPARAHLLLPPGEGRFPAVLVLPIRGGSHLVSEALAKALVERGYAVLRLERRRLFPPDGCDVSFAEPAQKLRDQVLDARRLIGWLAAHPRIDPRRLGVAGVSLGGILAATLMGVDERLAAGFFVMAGGGIPDILHDSGDGRLVCLRERTFDEIRTRDRDVFLERLQVLTEDVDPLTYASRVDPRRVLLVSARFDQVVRPEHSRRLWRALGRPAWVQVPSGHVGFLPFFWWSVGKGADHLDRVFAEPPRWPMAAQAPGPIQPKP